MNRLEAAARQALEALENHPGNYKLSKAECVKYNAVEAALREALTAQQGTIPDCGEAGHADGACGTRECLPSFSRNPTRQAAELVDADRARFIIAHLCNTFPELAHCHPARQQQAAEPVAVPQGWRLVPVEPTEEMWRAVHKLDDEMAAGCYDGRGCSTEQAWHCLLDNAPQPPAQQPLTEWEPIETAPQDGTEILGYRDGKIAVAYRVPRDDCEMWAFGGTSAAIDIAPYLKPTHWMRIPAPPVEAAHNITGGKT